MHSDEIIFNRLPETDLLYPSEEKRRAALKRKAQLDNMPTGFMRDLMIEQLIKQLTPHYQQKMTGIFSELSDDPEVIKYRQDILDDILAVPELSGTLRKIISTMLINDRSNIFKLSSPDSFTQLDGAIKAFEAYIECMEIMHGLYLKAGGRIKSLGIKRLFGYFERNYADKHYVTLKKETAQLRNVLEGKLRSATIAVNFDENLLPVSVGLVSVSDKPYDDVPTVFDRIISLGVKNQGNKVMKSLHKRFQENGQTNLDMVDKALFDELDFAVKKLVKSVEGVLDEYQAIGFEDMCAIEYQLDYYMGAVTMIENARAKGLEMCRPKILPVGGRAVINGLFDPIYFHEANVWNLNHNDKRSVITNDITFDDDAGFYILTGANNGGKTTFVRAVGICWVMAQAGLYVPAAYCELPPVDCIYTHFPKEERAGIDTSRFTTEIKEFKAISDVITDRSLLLMNESIQSTTPRECVEIASQLVRIFCVLGVRGVFATHITELGTAARELRDDKAVRTLPESITVLTDENTGERKYKVVRGLPPQISFAGAILQKFGLDIKALEERARQNG